MDSNVKNMLGIVLALTIIAFAYAALQYSNTYSTTQNQGSFSVSGEGKVTAVPDIAQITMSVITQGNTTDLPNLQTENTNKVNKLTEFIKSLNIEDKDIQTSAYSVTPLYTYPGCSAGQACPPASITGYSISNTLSVKVRNFDNTSPLLSGAVDKGANSVNGPSFTIDDPEELRSLARAKAIKQAQEKARAMAQAAGFKIGNLLFVGEDASGNGPLYAERGYAFGVGGGDAKTSPDIEPGSQEVIVNVSLTYEIK